MLMIIFVVSGWWKGDGMGEEKRKEQTALEETLEKIEGVGKVAIYYEEESPAEKDPLSNYFSFTETKGATAGNERKGILIVAEGGGNPVIKNRLSKAVATVLQLHEHQIMIVEMKTEGEME